MALPKSAILASAKFLVTKCSNVRYLHARIKLPKSQIRPLKTGLELNGRIYLCHACTKLKQHRTVELDARGNIHTNTEIQVSRYFVYIQHDL